MGLVAGVVGGKDDAEVTSRGDCYGAAWEGVDGVLDGGRVEWGGFWGKGEGVELGEGQGAGFETVWEAGFGFAGDDAGDEVAAKDGWLGPATGGEECDEFAGWDIEEGEAATVFDGGGVGYDEELTAGVGEGGEPVGELGALWEVWWGGGNDGVFI